MSALCILNQMSTLKCFSGMIPVSPHQQVSFSGAAQIAGSAQIGSAYVAGVNSALLASSASPSTAHLQGNSLAATVHLPGSGPTGSSHVQGGSLTGSAQTNLNSPATGTVQHMAQSPISRGELPGLLLGEITFITVNTDICFNHFVTDPRHSIVQALKSR